MKKIVLLLVNFLLTGFGLAAELPTTKSELLLRALEGAKKVSISVHSASMILDKGSEAYVEEEVRGEIITSQALEDAFRRMNLAFRPGNTDDPITVTRRILSEDGDLLFEGSEQGKPVQDAHGFWTLPWPVDVARLKLVWAPAIKVSDEEISHVYATLRNHRGEITGHRYLKKSDDMVFFPQDLLGVPGEMYVVLDDGRVHVYDLASGERRPDIRIYVDTHYLSIENLVEIWSWEDEEYQVRVHPWYFEAYVLETREEVETIIVDNVRYLDNPLAEGVVIKDMETHIETLHFLSPGSNTITVPRGKYRMYFERKLSAEDYAEVTLDNTQVIGERFGDEYRETMSWEITVNPFVDISILKDVHPSSLLWRNHLGEIDDEDIERDSRISLHFTLLDGNASWNGEHFTVHAGDEARFVLDVVFIHEGGMQVDKVMWEHLLIKPEGFHFKKYTLPKRVLNTSAKG